MSDCPNPELEGGRPAWMDEAACKGMDTRIFFPGSEGEHSNFDAMAICSGCPVQAECLEAGLWEAQGVWGMTSERQRRKIRKGRRDLEAPIVWNFQKGRAAQ